MSDVLYSFPAVSLVYILILLLLKSSFGLMTNETEDGKLNCSILIQSVFPGHKLI